MFCSVRINEKNCRTKNQSLEFLPISRSRFIYVVVDEYWAVGTILLGSIRFKIVTLRNSREVHHRSYWSHGISLSAIPVRNLTGLTGVCCHTRHLSRMVAADWSNTHTRGYPFFQYPPNTGSNLSAAVSYLSGKGTGRLRTTFSNQ